MTTQNAVDVGIVAGGGQTYTFPAATDTLVGRASTDTLTNKTISGASNTITNISLTTGVTGTLPVANGGTGVATITGIVKGNGTGAFSAAVSDTDYQAPITLTTTGTTGAATFTSNTLNIPNYAGTVSSVAATGTNGISVTGSPITTSGTLTITSNATSTPTASTIAEWDANKNFSTNNLFEGSTSTATAAGTTTLTTTSTPIQIFTGTTTQTVVLPTTSVPAGAQYTIINQSTGNVTVESSNAASIVVLAANNAITLTSLIATPTTPANWQYWYVTPEGANTQVQYNNSGIMGASANLTFNSGTNTLTATNVVGSTSVQTPTIEGTSSASYKINSGSYPNLTSDTYGTTVTFNLATSNTHTVTLTGNPTLALSNVNVGQCFMINLVQDATGGRLVTFFSTIKWPNGTTPTLSSGAGKTDVFGFQCVSSGNYLGYIIGQNL